MENEQQSKRIAYNWFIEQSRNGTPVLKDVFLYDRSLWDSMQKQLVEHGENPNHDDVKELVRRLDKGGWLGGIAEGRTFDEQGKLIQIKQTNYKETGHGEGAEGITREIARYANCMGESRLEEYYREPHWERRSRDYRSSRGWVCELCLKQHPGGSASLVTHHLTYRFDDGSKVFFAETDRELMAVCAEPCHQLADIARYMRIGRISQDEIACALSPLFAMVS